MAKQSLDLPQIGELGKLLRSVFKYLHELRDVYKMAERIQFPKIPPVLSESLVVILGNRCRLFTEYKLSNFQFSDEKGDVVAFLSDGQKLKIEVKSTGSKKFQSLGEKDIKADILVWVHFDSYFSNNNSVVRFFSVNNPKARFAQSEKMGLEKFIKLGNPTETLIDLDEVLSLDKDKVV